MATSLDQVGMQVWAGCLLMADFLLDKERGPTSGWDVETRHQTDNHTLGRPYTLLELGCGVGLASIVAAWAGFDTVFATDVDERSDSDDKSDSLVNSAGGSILEICKRNVAASNRAGQITVLPLNILKSSPFWVEPGCSADAEECPDLQQFRDHCDTIIAADVIYLDSVSFHLVRRLYTLLMISTPPVPIASNLIVVRPDINDPGYPPRPYWSRRLFLSIEMRVQFSIVSGSAAVPAWDFFRETVRSMNLDRSENDPLRLQLVFHRIDVDSIPQRFDYDRTPELRLFEVYLCQGDIQQDLSFDIGIWN
ncbi:Methyltransferase-like protein 22 [Cladochytrium tenue]|nr:Methyltransferase-like protein 22 [Cladochytrium tenue]